MTESGDAPTLADTKRAMDQARAALGEAGSGAVGTLECRLAGLQDTFLATPARDWRDLEARMLAIREIVVGLGERGYLSHLVDAALADVRRLGQPLG